MVMVQTPDQKPEEPISARSQPAESAADRLVSSFMPMVVQSQEEALDLP